MFLDSNGRLVLPRITSAKRLKFITAGVVLTAILRSVAAEFVAVPAARTCRRCGPVFAAATRPFSMKDPGTNRSDYKEIWLSIGHASYNDVP